MNIDKYAPYTEELLDNIENDELWSNTVLQTTLTDQGKTLNTYFINFNSKNGLTRPSGFLHKMEFISSLIFPAIRNQLEDFALQQAKLTSRISALQDKLLTLTTHLELGTFPKHINMAVKITSKILTSIQIDELIIHSKLTLLKEEIASCKTKILTLEDQKRQILFQMPLTIHDNLSKFTHIKSSPELGVFRNSYFYFFFLGKLQNILNQFKIKQEKDLLSKQKRKNAFEKRKSDLEAQKQQAASIFDVKNEVKNYFSKNARGGSIARPKIGQKNTPVAKKNIQKTQNPTSKQVKTNIQNQKEKKEKKKNSPKNKKQEKTKRNKRNGRKN